MKTMSNSDEIDTYLRLSIDVSMVFKQIWHQVHSILSGSNMQSRVAILKTWHSII